MSVTPAEKMREIRIRHPFPWREMVHPNGLVQLFDANGAEVALFDIVALAVITTATMAVQGAKAA